MKETEHLGPVFQSKLNFVNHLTEMLNKTKRTVSIIKHLNSLLPFKTSNQMYKSLVRSNLDYCDNIYHILHSVRPSFEGLGWKSFSDRRMFRKILKLHKIVNGKTRSYLKEKLLRNRNVLINLSIAI